MVGTRGKQIVSAQAPMVDLNGVRLRGRTLASASLVGYGAPPAARLIPYGLSPVARFLALERLGAVTTRTLTLDPRDGHFSARSDWRLRDWPQMLAMYRGALRRIDGGWINAFGWSNVGVEAYLRDYFPRTAHLNRIVSIGGFSGDEFRRLVERMSDTVEPGAIAALELNVSCHNVNFPFEQIMEDVLDAAVERSAHPLIVKLSPDSDYVAAARMAQERGVAALTACNTVKGLRLDPKTGRPFLANRYGGMSGRAIKPIVLRVVSELREAGVRLPIIATGGIRTFDDAREYFWAGADAVSLGSEAFLAPAPGYLLSPLKARGIMRLARQVERYEHDGGAALRGRDAEPVGAAGGAVPARV
jgi:dihydroorotate dehydrogenase (NAD+) catalytic subunit